MSGLRRLLTTTTDVDERNQQQQSSECNCELHSVTNTVADILAFITVIIIIIIIIIPWQSGRSLVWDVTVVCPLAGALVAVW